MQRLYEEDIDRLNLEFLGSGVSKMCYAIDEDYVLKVSMENDETYYRDYVSYLEYSIYHDVDQIEVEVDIWKHCKDTPYRDILAEVFDYYTDDEGRAYIIAERLTCISDFDSDGEISERIGKSCFDKDKKEFGDFLISIGQGEWVEKVQDFCKRLGFWEHETINRNNVGITKDNRLKVLDYGLRDC